MPSELPIPISGPSGHRELPSSYRASLQSASPIAQAALARDLAECSSDEGVDVNTFDGDSVSETGSNAGGPTLYRRPSGIAFGTSRPRLAPRLMDEPVLTRIEKQQSRDAERSLLRDNHILPPKHPVPQNLSAFQRLYKRLFSPKVRLPRSDQLETPATNSGASETSPLLPGAPGTRQQQGESPVRLDDQWEAAVATGQLRTTWQREAKTIAVYSAPLIVTFLLQYSVNIASIFAVGRIGKIELGAVSLATMSANITCYAFVQGLATSLDTLCAQAYGSGHKHLVGLQLQRMVCFLLIAVAPCMVVWWFADSVLALIIPEPKSADLAGLYLRILILGIPGFVLFECGKRFVQAQGLFHATTYVLLISAPFNAFTIWLFVWHFGWGFVGAPVAVVITQTLMPLLLFLYVYFVDGSQCWGGFSRRALSNWGPMIRLALPGMIMVEAEFFAFEVLTLASGQFGTSALAAQSILVTLTSTTFMLPFPISIAASTRIANLIGAKLADAAKTTAKVTSVAGLLIGLFNLTMLACLRYKLPLLFTQEPDVIEIVAIVIPICAVMQIFDGLAAVSQGLLRGIGWQEFGGYANLVSYYVVALPISFGTGFGLGWQLKGLWTGISIGLFLVSCVEYVFLYKSNWDRAVEQAERRNAFG